MRRRGEGRGRRAERGMEEGGEESEAGWRGGWSGVERGVGLVIARELMLLGSKRKKARAWKGSF